MSQIYFIYFWRRTRGRWCLQKLKEKRWTYLAHAKKTNMKSLEPPDPLEHWATCHFLLLDALIFMSSKNKVLDVTQQLPQEIIHSFHCCRLQGKKKEQWREGESQFLCKISSFPAALTAQMRRMFGFGVPPILMASLRILENVFTPLLTARTDLSCSHVLNEYTGLKGVRKHKHLLHKRDSADRRP